MNKIIKKISVYIDKNNQKNYDINININNAIIENMNKSLDFFIKLNNIQFKNNSIILNIPKLMYNINYENINIGICGNLFINHNNDKVVIEFHVKQLNFNTENQIIQQFEKKYKNKIKQILINDLLNIKERIGQFILNHVYIGIIMIFINNNNIYYERFLIYFISIYNIS